MGKIAQKFLKQAIKSYEKDDGATRLGSYRDALTDICHMAYKARVTNYTNDKLADINMLLGDVFSILQEELETAEVSKVVAIPKKKLPLHIHDTYEFNSAREQFNRRLKDENHLIKVEDAAACEKALKKIGEKS